MAAARFPVLNIGADDQNRPKQLTPSTPGAQIGLTQTWCNPRVVVVVIRSFARQPSALIQMKKPQRNGPLGRSLLVLVRDCYRMK
jgi:hypothetical protein